MTEYSDTGHSAPRSKIFSSAYMYFVDTSA